MSDRAGATPDGGAPDRFPPPSAAEAGVGGADERAPLDDAHSDPVIAPQPARPDEFEYDVPFDTGQLQALPTGQLLRVHRPPVDLDEDEVEEDTQRRVYSYVGAVFGVIGAVASLFVGWMLPLSIAGIVFGVLGLRREEHGRVPAFVGIGAGLVGLVFSAVWIGYYAIVFGALPR
jgi:hypothetical protein